MPRKLVNNIKLGVFVLAGLVFLILLLYMIGKNRNLFKSSYLLKVHMNNVQGLVKGNNVRYAGIESGTVKNLSILNDTVIEVSILMDKSMQKIIKKNAVVSIGTEGLVGNKVLNIAPSRELSTPAVEGDILVAKRAINTDEIMERLQNTNVDVSSIAAGLKITVERLNSSAGFWNLLKDENMPVHMRTAVLNIAKASHNANELLDKINTLAGDVQDGKGTVGMLLKDSSIAINLNEAVIQIRGVARKSDSLAGLLNSLTLSIENDVRDGEGIVNSLLKDSVMAGKVKISLVNIATGTAAFSENMEALKQNILFRGYFRRQEKKNRKVRETPNPVTILLP